MSPWREPHFVHDLLDNVHDAVVAIDADSQITLWNRAAEEIYGWAADEVMGRPSTFLDTRFAEGTREEALGALATTGRWRGRLNMLTKGGGRVIIEGHASALRDAEGAMTGVVSINRDVTHQAEVEALLQAREGHLAAIVEASPQGVMVVDESGLIVSANNACCRLFRAPDTSSLIGRSVEDLVPADLREIHQRQRENFGALGNGIRPMAGRELPVLRLDGTTFPAEIGLGSFATSEGSFVTVVLGDITARNETTERLRKAQERYRTLVEYIPAIVYIEVTEAEGSTGARTLFVSPQVESILGYTPDEWIEDQSLWATLMHEEDRERVMAAIGEALRSGASFNAEYRMLTRAGEVRWFRDQATPLRQDVGAHAWQGILVDITDTKLAGEQGRLRQKAETASEAKNAFLSRMSHELRTPLNAILGFAQLLQMDELRDDQQEGVGQILAAGNHLLELINEALDISRIETGALQIRMEPVQVSELIAETLDTLMPIANARGIRLGRNGDAEDPQVLADRRGLKQVLLNIGANAIKYNRPDGSVLVSVRRRGGRVLISVVDTGVGIAPEAHSLLWVPFERIGAEQDGIEGSGLGLPLSKSLVEAMGGTIEVASEPGTGSTFTVVLAEADPPPQPPS